jgi:two-component system, OmpR family, sensor histidine kinase ChvG
MVSLTQSKRSMELVIATRNSRRGDIAPASNRRRRRRRGGIAGIIFIANFAGVVILVLGSLLFNELRTGLTVARAEALRTQAATIASVLGEAAIPPEAAPVLDEGRARAILKRLFSEPGVRLRLFNKDRTAIADSDILYDQIEVRPLPPIGPAPPDIGEVAGKAFANARVRIQGAVEDPVQALAEEVSTALEGRVAIRERFDEAGNRVISVTVPIQRVRAVVAALTLETSDVNQIIQSERRALLPFIIAAILVTFVSATLLAWSIARPLRRLAAAADEVRRGRAQTMDAPELRNRPDEIGDLADALSVMTFTLQERIDANERFAADVAHEIKNPLAAIRNAAELLPRAKSEESKLKLENIILADARRVDRLVTDIANASRLDAELARASKRRFSMSDLVDEVSRTYGSIGHARGVSIGVVHNDDTDRLIVNGREEALSRILTNLLDNALSFSPDQAHVTVKTGRRDQRVVIVVEDEGPGIPEEAVEKIFKRFYTHRPTTKGEGGQAEFGTHSGLGLNIARQIAESHFGSLRAENRADRTGARFILELPGV